MDDSGATSEDTSVTFSEAALFANDSRGPVNEDSQFLSVIAVGTPLNGTAEINADGSVTYTPSADFNGTDSFSYTLQDSGFTGGSLDPKTSTATISVSVSEANDAPVTASDATNADEDTTISIDVLTLLANDTPGPNNEASQSLTLISIESPDFGSAILNGDGTISYTPPQDYFGPDTFYYTVEDDGTTDGNAAPMTSQGTVQITVVSINDAPVANDDSYITSEDNPLTITASGVLANDTDVEGDALTASLVTGPANGTVTLNADGSFVYTPNLNFNGPDTFTYLANDTQLDSVAATVTIDVTAVNDAPTISTISPQTILEDNSLNALSFTIGDVETDPEDLTVNATSSNGQVPVTITHGGSGASQTITIAPLDDVNGVTTITISVSDGDATTEQSFDLTITPINDAPVANDDTYITSEDTSLTIAASGVLANDTDVEGDALTASLVTGPANGTVTLNTDGSFVYTPNLNFNGPDTFTYLANDSQLDSVAATVTITVTEENDAPTISTINPQTILEDGSLNSLSLTVSDTETANENLTITATSSNDQVPVTITVVDGVSAPTLDVVPVPDIHGTTTITLTVTDEGGLTATTSFLLTISPVNDAPVANDDSYSVTEDTTLTIVSSGMLDNDVDVEGSTLSAVLVATPNNGSASFSSDGLFTYTPNDDFNGTDTFTYRANDALLDSDNLATVTITVTEVNDSPIATNDVASTNEDTTIVLSVASLLGNDATGPANESAQTLTLTAVGSPSHGTATLNNDGTISYTPSANYHGSDSFSYTIVDNGTTNGSNAAATAIGSVNVTIAAENDAPIAANDSYVTFEDTAFSISASGLLTNDSDVEGSTLTATLVNGPTGGAVTVNSNGSFTYTPDPDFNGTDTFTYRANDGTVDSNIATATITVFEVNDAPELTDDTPSTNEDTPLVITLASLLSNDAAGPANESAQSLTITSFGQPEHGTVTVNGDGTVTYSPDENYHGTDSFTYSVADNGTTNGSESGITETATVSVTVVSINDLPIAVDDTYTAYEDYELSIHNAHLLLNDSDADNSTLTASVVAAPTNGTLDLDADGTFEYTPNADYHGVDSFTYRVNDGIDDSNVATVTINVTSINDAPRLTDDTFSIDEDEDFLFNINDLLINDVPGPLDELDQSLTITHVSAPSSGHFWTPNNYRWYWPESDYNGDVTFTYTVLDDHPSNPKQSIGTATINIAAINDPPTLQPISDQHIDEDTTSHPITLDVDDVDTGDNLTVSAESLKLSKIAQEDVILTESLGNYTLTVKDAYGRAPIRVTVTDLAGAEVSQYFDVFIDPVNDKPTSGDFSLTTPEDTSLDLNPEHFPFTDIEQLSISGLRIDSLPDPEIGKLRYYNAEMSVGQVISGRYQIDSGLWFVPVAGVSGTTTFDFSVKDRDDFSATSSTATIHVDSVEDIPTSGNVFVSTDEDTPRVVNAEDFSFHDGDGDPLQEVMLQVPSGEGQFSFDGQAVPATTAITISRADIDAGKLVFTPDADDNGWNYASIHYRVSDGKAYNNSWHFFRVNVDAVNDAPVAADDSYSINEDRSLVISSPGLVANDHDIDSFARPVVDEGPSHGRVENLTQSGSFTYVPDADFAGTDTFTYYMTDGLLDSALATVTITVSPINDAPVANDSSHTIASGSVINGSIAQFDVDFNSLTALIDDDVDHGTLHWWNGSFRYIPDSGYVGSDSFTYKITDDDGLSDTGTVHFNIIEPVAEFYIEAIDSVGQSVTSALVGDELTLYVYAEDRRNFGTGISQAFLDVLYDTDAVELTGDVRFGGRYATGARSNLRDGVIDNAGGRSDAESLDAGKHLVYAVPFTVNEVGTTTISSRPAAKHQNYEVRTFDNNDFLNPSLIGYGTLELDVNPRSPGQNPNNRFDVNNDGLITEADYHEVTGHISVHDEYDLSPTSQPNKFYDVDGDFRVTYADANLVAAAINDLVSGEGEVTLTSSENIGAGEYRQFEVNLEQGEEYYVFLDTASGLDPDDIMFDCVGPQGMSMCSYYQDLDGNPSQRFVASHTGNYRFLVGTTYSAGSYDIYSDIFPPDYDPNDDEHGEEVTVQFDISTIAVTVAEGNAGQSFADFIVEVDGPAPLPNPVSVNYTTFPFTATEGVDYKKTSGTLNFSGSTTTQQIRVPIVGDKLVEPDESFSIELSAPTNAWLGDWRTAHGGITNDDGDNDGDDQPLTLSINDVTVTEGDVGDRPVAKFTVSLSGDVPAGEEVTVRYRTADVSALAAADYIGTSGKLTFKPGDLTKHISVPVLGDILEEDDETFSVILEDLVGAQLSRLAGIGTIVDDDTSEDDDDDGTGGGGGTGGGTPPDDGSGTGGDSNSVTISVDDVTVVEGAPATFTISLGSSVPSGETLTVSYKTVNGSATPSKDYTHKNGSVSFSGSTTTQTVSVTTIDDTIEEDNETFKLKITSTTGVTVSTSPLPVATATITDNDGGQGNDIKVSVTGPTEAVEEGDLPAGGGYENEVEFTIAASSAPTSNLTVSYVTADGTAVDGFDSTGAAVATEDADYVAIPAGSITLTPSDYEKTVTVQIKGDHVEEEDENFYLKITGVSSGGKVDSDKQSAEATIQDDDEESGPEVNARIYDIDHDYNSGICGCGTMRDGTFYKPLSGAFTISSASMVHPNYQGDGSHNTSSNINVIMTLPSGGTPTKVDMLVSAGGLTSQTVSFDSSSFSSGSNAILGINLDTSSLETGAYGLSVGLATHFSDGSTAETLIEDELLVFNLKDSYFGSRFWLPGLSMMVPGTLGYGGGAGTDATGGTGGGMWGDSPYASALRALSSSASGGAQKQGVTLIRGDNTASWYEWDPAGQKYIPPKGGFSKLEKKSEDEYVLTHKHGDKEYYNGLGVLVKQVDRNGNITEYEYINVNEDGKRNELYRIIGPNNRITTYSYNNGILQTVTDPAGRVTEYINLNGKIREIRHPDPDPTNAPSVLDRPIEKFYYDADGRVLHHVDAEGKLTEHDYHADSRLKSKTYADGATWQYTHMQLSGLVVFEDVGPDALHSLVQPDSVISTVIDGEGAVTRTLTDDFGHVLEQQVFGGGRVVFERDEHGQMLKQIVPDPDGAGPLGTLTSEYRYDSLGNMLETVHPDGSVETWRYNNHSFPYWYMDELERQTQYIYDSHGNMTHELQLRGNRSPPSIQVLGLGQLDGSRTRSIASMSTMTE